MSTYRCGQEVYLPPCWQTVPDIALTTVIGSVDEEMESAEIRVNGTDHTVTFDELDEVNP